ncbi:protein crumbs homolog 1 isoform X2 [Narcine bancroftii]|uniref:protein crumbs homolog 1 isoform X2 n=1 Tax=Narcine bancroftii TaxID=1343680 RepID=UPI003831E49B
MALCDSSRETAKLIRSLRLLLFIVTQSSCFTTILNKCLSSPCKNNATCEDLIGDYICHCPQIPVSFTGKNCEELFDVCASHPCQHNATCKSNLGTTNFFCDCPPGHISCEISINKCASIPCLNGATCLDNAAGYSCVCPLGYTGTDCGTNLNNCAANPCENGAVCKDKLDGFSCFCVPGFQGRLCEIEVDECASEPCKNYSTCMNQIDKYVCICPLGLTGTQCELEINECLSQPCLNGATCQDHFSGYICTCAPGFIGNTCEMDFDECASHPCHNGGKCIDKANGYSCDCMNSSYMGLRCEIDVLSCSSQPCLNSATCQDMAESYTCLCWPGFTGAQCEIDIHECFSNPCLHGGECIELSWQNMYGKTTELPAVFSYEHASGFICKCQHGFIGLHCEMDVDECDSDPCQNGGTCQNIPEGYTCHCPAGNEQEIFYGGQNCTDILTGCENNECQNKATCIPYLMDSQHRHHCLCAHGYTGLNCELSTTFSFAVSGHLHFKTSLPRQSEELVNKCPYHIFLRCRTVLSNAIIFHRGNRETFMELEVLDGHFSASLQIQNKLIATLELFKNVSDGHWHNVEVTFSSHFSVKLLDNSCSGECMIQKLVDMESSQLASAFENLYFGGIEDVSGDIPGGTQPKTGPHFIGCFQDVMVESEVMDLETTLIDSALNVKPGCSKTDWCQRDPCKSRGRCIDLLINYKCECFRPYVGLNCSKELIPGRFGHEGFKGYASFTIDDDPGEEVNISMFVRSRKPNGLLLILKNNSVLYLRMELDAGCIVVYPHLSKPLTSDNCIADSNFYLITVEIKQNKMKLIQSGEVVGHVQIPPIRIQAGDVAYIGGLPEHVQGTRYFEGCIQDVKINNKRLEFYPFGISEESYNIRTLENITSGCTGINACEFSPCLNGGTCSSIWGDFVCTCPPNTSGKTCSQVQWCQFDPCPQGSKCHMLRDGLDCFVSATFKGEEGLIFQGNGKIKRELTNITFSLRTRESNAAILHAVKQQDMITVGIQRSHLIFMVRSGNIWGNQSIVSTKQINDGLWHDVIFYMSDPLLQYSNWRMKIDKKEEADSAAVNGNLNFLREGTDIYLGGGGEEKGGSFRGCLNTIRISGISLSYFATDSVHIIKPQQEQFIQTPFKSILLGCPMEHICASNPCKNNGNCEDVVSYYKCSCPSGWVGLNCENNINGCQSSSCIHGNCTDKILPYKCICLPGFTGTDCEVKIDNCQKHKCVNGATCIDAISSYSCRCPSIFTGRYCEHRRLSATFCNDEMRNWTCYNGGNCAEEKNALCTCPIGFTGSQCEIDIDECESSPCLNGGFCQNLPNKFQCICNMSFAGDRCEFDSSCIFMVIELQIFLKRPSFMM